MLLKHLSSKRNICRTHLLRTCPPVNLREVSTFVQQPQTAQTSDTKNPLQEDTIPRVTAPVVAIPSADIPINHQKGSTFTISTAPDKTKIAYEVPERQSSTDHGDDTPLMITSQSVIQNDVAETVAPVDQGIKGNPRCETVPLAAPDTQISPQSTEKSHNTYRNDSNSPEGSTPDPITDGVGGDRKNGKCWWCFWDGMLMLKKVPSNFSNYFVSIAIS